MDFEQIYKTTIEILYGKAPDPDFVHVLMEDNEYPHDFSITDRLDLTHLEVYSIDPEGCEDADDAFSIYNDQGLLWLAIHIADPTEYINLESSLWREMGQSSVTKYPSNRKPIHLIPTSIREKSSLIENKEGNLKNAISILSEISQSSFRPIGNIQILFSTIKVCQNNAFSYQTAAGLSTNHKCLQLGLQISCALKEIRGQKTIGIKLNEISNSYPVYKDGRVLLYQDSYQAVLIKQMIAEFAIFANSFVGEYLKINLQGMGIFRTCNSQDWLTTVYSDISGNELLTEIITKGIKAEYLSQVFSHDLVGVPEYCHFTSPIRRFSDCVCHYLLKYIYWYSYKNIMIPFSYQQLSDYSHQCLQITKNIKKIQYRDIKFRLIQAMSEMLNNKETLQLSYYITSYKCPFLNIIICQVDHHHIHLSYTLKRNKMSTLYNPKERHSIRVSKINCPGKFDEGSIPELDSFFE